MKKHGYVTNNNGNNNKKNTFKKLQEKITATGKPYNFRSKINVTLNVKQQVSKLNTENVLAYVEGTDLKEELIVITGH